MTHSDSASETLAAIEVARALHITLGTFRVLCSRSEFPEPDAKTGEDQVYRWRASTVAPWAEAYRLQREGAAMRRALLTACQDHWGGRGARYRVAQNVTG